MTELRDLITSCPVFGCKDNEEKTWSHSCGSRIRINTKANLVCNSCNKVWFILDSLFACKGHLNVFKEADPLVLKYALTIMKDFAVENDKPFFTKLMKNFNKEYDKRFPDSDDSHVTDDE